MRLPTWDELIPEQRDILDVPLNESVFVAGPPGSGKTVLAVQRARSVAQTGTVLLITYNRMLRRLVALLGVSDVETMQAFVTRDYRQRTGTNAPKLGSDPYALDWDSILKQVGRAGVKDIEHLVIDEGQDLPSSFFTYAIHNVCKSLSVFADEDQALRPDATTLAQLSALRRSPIQSC